jgi:multidrug efflux pump subunit AcrA (membrane-fusion protein)
MLLERETVARLRALAEGQRERLRGMRVLATERGVVQELRVEPGQWVTVGEPLVRVADAMALQAVLKVPEAQVPELAVGQSVRLESRAADAGGWRVPGKVSRIAPSVTSGTVAVEVALSEPPPAGAARDLAIDGVVEIEQLTGALTIARAGSARPGSEGVVYRVSADGTTARRAAVRFGRASLNRIEVVSGVSPGDVIIVSDLALEGSPDVIGLRR